jgi:hypothetical protein
VIELVAPTIQLNDEPVFCQGESLVLSTTEGVSYLWSTGAQTQTLEVTQSGSYTVQVQGVCGEPLTSEPLEVVVLAAPEPIIAQLIEVNAGIDTEIFAAGENVSWFDSADANVAVNAGNTLTVNVSEPTSFWLESTSVYGGAIGDGGKQTIDEEGGQFHTNSSFWLKFDAYEDFILESVKVFSGATGNRTIALIDQNGTTIQSAVVNIPVGEHVVTLDFFVPEGTGYGLRTIGNNPQLWRDGPPAPMAFPYPLGELGAVTGTSITGQNEFNFYYFFYDWKVKTPSVECVSERIEVVIQPLVEVDCFGDFDGDGVVSTSDLLILLANFGCIQNCTIDLDGDGTTTTADLLLFLSVFGTSCD